MSAERFEKRIAAAPYRLETKTRRKRSLACAALARLRGFEPPTYRLGGGRSILLSYRRMYM